jgi:esterase/lipase superfamily enzyme
MRALGFLGGADSSYDALVGFAWPGGAVGVSFPFARGRAGESAARFGRLITGLRSVGATIDLNTHSLGAHVAFEALQDLPAGSVRLAWNFAAAVDNESVEFRERYYDASQRCARFYIFHSKKDPVLRTWYRLGDFFDFDTALGYSGPEDPRAIIDHSQNVRVINCKEVVSSHGGYRSAGQIWSFMAQELTNPTGEQFTTLTKTATELKAVFKASGGSAFMAAARRARVSSRPARTKGRRTRKASAASRERRT